LSLLVNAARNLGETITEEKIVKKIFRVLPSRFIPKKAAIEEHSLLSEIKLDILISKLVTFEMELSNCTTPKKSKDIALQAKGEHESPRNLKKIVIDFESANIDSQMALVAKQYERFRKSRGRFSHENSSNFHKGSGSNPPPNVFRNRDKSFEHAREDKPMRKGPQCYECDGFGHIAKDCTNRLRKESNFDHKALNASWSDSDDSSSSDEDEPFVAFVAKVDTSSKLESNHDLDNVDSLSSDDESEDEFMSHKEVYEKVDELFQMTLKDKEMIMNLNIRLVKLQKEKDNSLCVLKEEIIELEKEILEKNSLIDTLSIENDKLKCSVDDLRSKGIGMTLSGANLDKILTMGKSPSDKSGLGFNGESSTSSPLKTKFVKALVPKPIVVEPIVVEPIVVESPKAPKPKRFVPTCHHCGKLGHIRPHCYALKRLPRSPPLVKKGPLIKKFVPTCHNCGEVGHIRPKCLAPKGTHVLNPSLFAKIDSWKSYSPSPSSFVDDTSLHSRVNFLMNEVVKLSKMIVSQASNGCSPSPTQKVWVKKDDGC
jgi:hypothetical protein